MIAAAVPVTYADAYPLALGGGMFLAVVGSAILLGAVFFEAKNLLLAAGGALGTAAACGSGGYVLRHSHGTVTGLAVGSLVFAVAVEMALLPMLRRRLRTRGERTLLLAILVLVGAHFLPMLPAFGPLIEALGLLAMANAAAGLKFPALPFRGVWLADGLLKLAFGVLLWLGSPRLPVF